MKRRPLVYVRWNDAEHPTTGEWLHQDGLSTTGDMMVETAGFLVHRSRERILVAVSLACRNNENEQYTGVMMIPMSAVISIMELTPTIGKLLFQRKVKSPRLP